MFKFTEIIKSNITMIDICKRYGFSVQKGNFICCPFHKEKTPSLKLYGGDKGYYCFGCGEHGDAISFVQKYFNLSFSDAIRKINDDFCLGLPIGNLSFDALRTIHFNQKALQAKREREQREKEKADAEYWAAFDEWKRLDDNRRIYKPKSEDDELHPLFVESLQKISYQEYILDILDKRRVS